MSFSIRRATEADAEGILAAHVASIRAFAAPFYSPEVVEDWAGSKRAADYAPFIAESHFYVAEEGGRIAGFGHFRIGEAEAEMMGLYIAPWAARRGIGAEFMRRFEQAARAAGLRSLRVRSTLNAEPFYARCGFRTLERTVHCLRSGRETPCVLMARDLCED